MDAIYPAFGPNASAKIRIKEHFEKFERVLPPAEYPDLNRVFFSEEKCDELSKKCSDSFLDYQEPNQPLTLGLKKSKNIPAKTELQTLRWLKEKVEAKSKKKRPTDDPAGPLETPVEYEEKSENPEPAPRSEIVVFIRVYNAQRMHEGQTHAEPSLMLVGAILGSQTLDKLRDIIPCVSDLTPLVDRSDDPFAEPREDILVNKEIYKSGFFFIEDVFYNDIRGPDHKDNSAVIRNWAETRGIGPFSTAKMEETRVDTMTVRFGYPYVYQHQGTCEHFIVFSDARFADPELEDDVLSFPRVDRVHAFRHRKCMVCGDQEVKWIIRESDRIPHDPCYFCPTCFISYNYLDGKKIGRFKAYHWPYNPEIVKMRNDMQKQEMDTS